MVQMLPKGIFFPFIYFSPDGSRFEAAEPAQRRIVGGIASAPQNKTYRVIVRQGGDIACKIGKCICALVSLSCGNSTGARA